MLKNDDSVELVGDPGLGKTTVWNAVVHACAADLKLSFACQEAEAGFGLVLVSDLLTRVRRASKDPISSALPPLLSRALEVITFQRGPEDLAAPLDTRLIGSVISAVLSAAATGRTVLVAIDDLQWCDPGSFAALRFAALRTTGGRVKWLAARRPDTEQRLPSAVGVQLSPLPPDALQEVISTRLGVTLKAPVRRVVTEVSGGNPMYALELARNLPENPVPDDVRLPPTLRQLVTRRVQALPGPTRSALLDLSVRGSLGNDYMNLRDLDPAFDAGVLTQAGSKYVFTHPLMGSGILDSATPAARATAHRNAAADETDPVIRARHLAAATTRPDDTVAAELDGAVEIAGRRGDAASAAWLAARAVALTEGEHPPWHRIAAAARWSAVSYDAVAAADYARRMAAEARTPNQRAEAALQDCYANMHDLNRAMDSLVAGLSLDGVDSDLRLRLMIEHGRLHINLGQHLRAIELLAEALDGLEPGTPAWAGLVGELSLAQRAAGLPVDLGLLDAAGELARRHRLQRPFNPLVQLGTIAIWDDRHHVARRAFADVIDIAPGSGLDEEARFHLAELDVRVGRLRVASQAARELSARWEGQDLAAAMWVLAMTSAWLGDQGTCRQAADHVHKLTAGTGDQLFSVACRVAVGFLELTLGDMDAAWPVLRDAAAALFDQACVEPSVFPAVPLAIEAAVEIGEIDSGYELLNRLIAARDQLESRWAAAAALRCEGLLLRSKEPDTAADLLTQAADSFGDLELRLERARCLLQRGILLRQHRHRSDAQADLAQAYEVFTDAGAAILAASAQRELGRLGRRGATDATTLTPSEQQVADLVCAGLSNTDIAANLHLSVKTVEAHLTHVYQKTAVRSRAELIATMALAGELRK